jgi:hypothetical protein
LLSNMHMQQWRNCWKWYFLCGPCIGHIREPWNSLSQSELSRVEEGLNTSTTALRDVGGDEKGTQFLGV